CCGLLVSCSLSLCSPELLYRLSSAARGLLLHSAEVGLSIRRIGRRVASLALREAVGVEPLSSLVVGDTKILDVARVLAVEVGEILGSECDSVPSFPKVKLARGFIRQGCGEPLFRSLEPDVCRFLIERVVREPLLQVLQEANRLATGVIDADLRHALGLNGRSNLPLRCRDVECRLTMCIRDCLPCGTDALGVLPFGVCLLPYSVLDSLRSVPNRPGRGHGNVLLSTTCVVYCLRRAENGASRRPGSGPGLVLLLGVSRERTRYPDSRATECTERTGSRSQRCRQGSTDGTDRDTHCVERSDSRNRPANLNVDSGTPAVEAANLAIRTVEVPICTSGVCVCGDLGTARLARGLVELLLSLGGVSVRVDRDFLVTANPVEFPFDLGRVDIGVDVDGRIRDLPDLFLYLLLKA